MLCMWSRSDTPIVSGHRCGALCMAPEVQFRRADSRGSASRLEMVDLLGRHRNVLTEGSLRLCASAGSIRPRQFCPLNMSGAQVVVCLCARVRAVQKSRSCVRSCGCSLQRTQQCRQVSASLQQKRNSISYVCWQMIRHMYFFFLRQAAFLFRVLLSVLVHSEAFFVSGGYGGVHT